MLSQGHSPVAPACYAQASLWGVTAASDAAETLNETPDQDRIVGYADDGTVLGVAGEDVLYGSDYAYRVSNAMRGW